MLSDRKKRKDDINSIKYKKTSFRSFWSYHYISIYELSILVFIMLINAYMQRWNGLFVLTTRLFLLDPLTEQQKRVMSEWL